MNETRLDVMQMSEARAQLARIARSLESGGAASEPVFVGAHRRPTMVLLSLARYETLLDVLDNLSIFLEVRKREAADDGTRFTLDDVLGDLGFTREQLEAPTLAAFTTDELGSSPEVSHSKPSGGVSGG